MIRRVSCALVVSAVFALPALAAGGIDPDLLAGMKARSIGPAGMSGRIADIEASVSNPDLVYVGAATGGVWKSTNGGLTWKPVFDEQPVHAIGAVAIFQPNPSIVWVGTGEGNPRNSASVGNGAYRSMDGGETWEHIGLDNTERIHRLVLHPSESNVAFACALGREWGENPERGVFKTLDGGRTWRKVLYVDEKTGCGELVMDPSNPNKLIAGMWQFRRWPWFFKSGGPSSGIHISHDGGETWKRLQPEDGLPQGELGRIGLAIAPSNPEIVYALVEATQSALLRSQDGGLTWTTVNSAPGVSPRPFYYADIHVDPVWPHRIYKLHYTVEVSNDGGTTFENLPGAEARHGDNHAIWINPRDPEHLLIGDDGGVGVSHDRGMTTRFVENLPLAQYYHVAVDNEVPYNIYGGLQDNGSWRGPSDVWRESGIRNYDWQYVGSGDGFDVQPDPSDSKIGYSMSQGGYLMRWNLVTGEMTTIRPAPTGTTKLRFNWNAALAIDPFEPGTIYYGSQFVHRSTDRGNTWEIVSPDLTTNKAEWQKQDESGGLTLDVTAAENFTTLVTIAPSTVAKGVIWAGSDDGRLHVTRDGGKTWTSVEGNVRGVPANTWIPHIEASKFDAAEAFAVFDDHRRSNGQTYVYRTRDYGKTWENLTTSDLRGYALVLEQDPVDRDLLFLGTEFGLWISLDGGRNWQAFRHGLPTASVMDLVVHPREHDLVIATHGRALFVIDDVRPLRTLTAETLKKPLHLFAIPDAQQHAFRSSESGNGPGNGEFEGESRAYGAVLTFATNAAGLPHPDADKERTRKEQERQEQRKKGETEKKPEEKGGRKEGGMQAKVTVTAADGTELRTFEQPVFQGLNRIVWNFNRDAFKSPPREGSGRDFGAGRGGPEVPPGTYTVTLRVGEAEAKQSVRVLADPRSKNTEADWQNRWATISDLGSLNDRAVEALERIKNAQADAEYISSRVRQAAKARGEKDDKTIEEDPLIVAGGELSTGLKKLYDRAYNGGRARGILPDDEVMSPIRRAMRIIGSSTEPPTPTQLVFLAQAKEALEKYLVDLDAFFEKDVAAYRQKIEAAGVGMWSAK